MTPASDQSEASSVRSADSRIKAFAVRERVASDIESHNGNTEERDYRTLKWWQAALIMTASTSSLGLLSLPEQIKAVGTVPACITIVVLGGINYFTGLLMFQWIMQHPWIYCYADMLRVVFGRMGAWGGLVAQTSILVSIMAVHNVAFNEGIRTIFESYGLCSWMTLPIGAVVMWVPTIMRGFDSGWYLSVASILSILSAATIGAVGVSQVYPGFNDAYIVTPSDMASLALVARTISSIQFVFMGHIAFPAILSEMRDPKEFRDALRVSSVSTTVIALCVATVYYVFAGSEIGSPALNSAGPLFGKIAYGLAVPTIIGAAVISCIVAAKKLYRDCWSLAKAPEVVQQKSWRARVSWGIITALLWIAALTFGMVVPDFHQIVPLVGAIFGPFFCLIMPAIFAFHLSSQISGSSRFQKLMLFGTGLLQQTRQRPMFVIRNGCILLLGLTLLGLGVYGSYIDLRGGQSSASRICRPRL